MVKYEHETVWCSRCRQKVPVVFGNKGLCGPCHRLYYGNTKTLTEMEQKLIEQEDEIANLQTIINLMNDMSAKIKEHQAMIATTE